MGHTYSGFSFPWCLKFRITSREDLFRCTVMCRHVPMVRDGQILKNWELNVHRSLTLLIKIWVTRSNVYNVFQLLQWQCSKWLSSGRQKSTIASDCDMWRRKLVTNVGSWMYLSSLRSNLKGQPYLHRWRQEIKIYPIAQLDTPIVFYILIVRCSKYGVIDTQK